VFSSDKAGLNATFYDDRLNACTSIFGEMRMRLLSVLFSTRRCCCTLLDVVVVRELYIYIYIYNVFSTDYKKSERFVPIVSESHVVVRVVQCPRLFNV
jgi:hypothetical protein